ncbi:hypothetical protein F528_0229 [Neisseria meningitidis 992008]|uniref:Uncharacterized protein n=2 Tax=Neisseria meningitidis TaxID=487 RepID=E0NCV2_NEIM3|nr:hypothetical protein HMPREF0602_2334 [Neisseria meningitidis ATCC 13091]KER40805.1 hypothetical protein F528_0229 [Neisseria meningitidis 992008]
MAAGGVEAVVGHFGFRLKKWQEDDGGFTSNQDRARGCRTGLKSSHYIIATFDAV